MPCDDALQETPQLERLTEEAMRYAWFWFMSYVATIFAANWAITTFGVVPVGFGLYAPAGVYFAGFAFTFRNAVQQTLGRRWGYIAIVIGALLSVGISAHAELGGPLPLYLASGIAFALSETADMLVWSNLPQDWWIRRMGIADLASQIVDSLLFLALAFGSVELWLGQTVGKAWCTWATMLVMWLAVSVVSKWRAQSVTAQVAAD
jgi:queuosine precursor transporter